ncbi:MAG: hypothetical protein KDJ47_14265 [Hyphomicrobiaceae bacterium]|nr:hypothetical protein [Hyphomicrobiaceae bacterium]
MRKGIINLPAAKAASGEHPSLDIARLAVAELSSEDPEHPIEAAIDALGMRPPVPETILEKPQISGPD